MIAPTPFFADRGCHVRIFEETRTLRELGHKVTIVTYHNGRDIPGFDIRRIPPVLFWYNKLEAGPSWWKFFLDFLLLLKCLWISYTEHFDIIHAHLHEGALIGWFCSCMRFKKIPLVFDYQGSLTGELLAHHFVREHRAWHGTFRALEKKADRAADVIICSSTNSATVLKNDFDIKEEKVFVILDGVNTSEFRPGYDVCSLRAELGLPHDKKIVVFLGVLSEYQGVDLLLEAIPQVLENFPEVHFLIMGYPNVEKYKKKAGNLGLLSHTTFTGRIPYEKAPLYLSLGDVAVAPKISKTEANGKLYNYMACGLPSVVFESQVNREILGDLGVYADFGDSADLARKLISLLKNEQRRRELASALKNKAVNKHSWGKSSRKIVAVYRQLLS